MLTDSQNVGSQGKSSSTSSGTLQLISCASGSNSQQLSVVQASGRSVNYPYVVAIAKVSVKFNCLIQICKAYYPKNNKDFETCMCHLKHYVTFWNVSHKR